jgi:hypothetical protein
MDGMPREGRTPAAAMVLSGFGFIHLACNAPDVRQEWWPGRENPPASQDFPLNGDSLVKPAG